MYAVAVMPVLLAAGWRVQQGLPVRLDQLVLFLLAAVLLLAWENLANDVFDADTGVDATGKPHSLVNLTGQRNRVSLLANGALLLGLLLIALVAARSRGAVLALVLAYCGLGSVYQGPPFRLGYRGWPALCWLAFGPLATAAGLWLCPRGGGRGALACCAGAGGPHWQRPWCCSAPTSIRWKRTPPTANARRSSGWERAGRRPWCPGLWRVVSLLVGPGARQSLAIDRASRCGWFAFGPSLDSLVASQP